MTIADIEFRITATTAAQHLFESIFEAFLQNGGTSQSPAIDFIQYSILEHKKQVDLLNDLKKELIELGAE